jgi:hypothetical protein
MSLWRALSNGVRMYCPDILAGVYTAEELGTGVNEEGGAIPRSERENRPVEAKAEDEPGATPIPPLSGSQAPKRPAVDESEECSPDDNPRPEWLRVTAQQLREHLTQDELMALRLMWRDSCYSRDEITERMRSLAAKYGQKFALPEED